jgi:hypothetical protein
VAIVTALVVDWQWQRHGKRLLHPSVLHGLKQEGDDSLAIAKRSWTERTNNITQTALHDFVDILAFLVLGSLLAAGGKFLIKESNIQEYLQSAPAIAILLMMGVAVLFCLCSEADAFVAANFPLFWPDASKLAFMVLGPMLDLKLLLMYTRVFRARLIYTIAICLVVQVFVYTLIADAVFGKVHPPESTSGIESTEEANTMNLVVLTIGGGQDPYTSMVAMNFAYHESAAGEKVSYKTFTDLASHADLRQQWKDKIIEVRGQFEPFPRNERVFLLSRLKITCCRSDVTTLRAPIITREPVRFDYGTWVDVKGRVDFIEERPGSFKTVLHVTNAKDVKGPVPKDNDPYVQ